jgi:SAM-dependent methyltransferase
MTLSDSQVKGHLQDYGLTFGLSGEELDQGLEKLMGQERFQNYRTILDTIGCPVSGVYELVESLEEAHLVISHQSELVLKTALWLLGRLEHHVQPGCTIVDLGCWAGAITRLLATAFPDCTVIGIDRATRVIDLASNAYSTIPNLQFRTWDYSRPDGKPDIRADVVVSTLGMDLNLEGGTCSLDVRVLRYSPAYTASLAALKPYLACWRLIATDGASLHAMLRLSDPDRMLAFADAAHLNGWTLLLSDCTTIAESSDSHVPALSLVAREPAKVLPEDEVVSWYGWTGRPRLEHKGAQAIALYRALGEKIVIRTRSKTFDDGHIMTVEVGRAGTTGYLFARATTDYAELRLAGLLEIDDLTPSFGWERLDPVTDGVLRDSDFDDPTPHDVVHAPRLGP